jgi:flavorubredoxin
MEAAYKVAEDVYALPSHLEVPLLGLVPVNAFLLKAREPVLVDTGMAADSPAFLESLRNVIDPKDLKWIWLTHPDPDHIGSLHPLLKEAPQVKVITTFLGFGIMGLINPLPMDRVYFLNPGQQINLGDRTLTAVAPPTFDNPCTTGCYDSRSDAFFSADYFGAVLSAPAQEAGEVPADALRHGQLLWESIDHPWIQKVDRQKFAADLEAIRRMNPRHIMCSHLPPASGMTASLLETMALTPDAAPYVGPDQAVLEQLLAQLSGSPPPESPA